MMKILVSADGASKRISTKESFLPLSAHYLDGDGKIRVVKMILEVAPNGAALTTRFVDVGEEVSVAGRTAKKLETKKK